MNKQTAVEFLIKEFNDILGPLDTKPMQDLLMMDAMKRAKHMEKWQIKGAYQKGRFSGQTNWGYGNDVTAEQYYNETYGGNNNIQ
jgi:hypothetical protein